MGPSLNVRRRSSESSYKSFSISSLPPPVEDDVLFEDLAKQLHKISKVSGVPIQQRKAPSKGELKRKTHLPLEVLFALVPLESPSRTRLGKALFDMIFPHMDIHRRYNMQEGKLGRTLANVLNVQVGRHPSGAWKEGEALNRWDDASFWAMDSSQFKNWSGSMGQVVQMLQTARKDDPERKSMLTVTQVDYLLNKLASHSTWSSQHVRDLHPEFGRHSNTSILTFMLNSLSPPACNLLTQLLLRDITPFLHPPPDTRAATSLLFYDQASIYRLLHWEIMDLWDRSGQMKRAYRLRGNFSDALDAVDRGEDGIKVGVNIEIPKCTKGRALRYSLKQFHDRGSRSVYAETKYDGERMQIHVDLSLPPHKQIKIFSKSKRDSTRDRSSAHPFVPSSDLGSFPSHSSLTSSRYSRAILSALSLSLPHNHLSHLYNHHLLRRLPTTRSPSRRIQQTIILEAEMVPYNERKSKIEEFWKITACAGDSRAAWSSYQPSEHDSQEKDSSDLHLMLVFFDVLEMDGEAMIWKSYGERRKRLEEVVKIVPGFTMLAERYELRMHLGIDVAEEDLQLAFAQSLSAHEEGLVLKSAQSRYNCSPAWVKLKRDYIPGLDDTIDLVVVGASWDKDRGRELNVAPSVFTTFHIGVRDGSRSGSPHVLVLFSVSYGLDRKQLEDWNFRLHKGDHALWVPYGRNETLSYSFELTSSLKPPMVMLKQPLLGEMFGAGFQKLPKSRHFELRWPRLSKIYPRLGEAGGKSWLEGLASSAYRKLALAALGRQDPAEQIAVSLSDSLDLDMLFPSPGAAVVLEEEPLALSLGHKPTFWEEKLKEEGERQLQEEEKRAREAATSTEDATVALELELVPDQKSSSPTPSPSPRKKRMVGLSPPPSTQSLLRKKKRETSSQPGLQHLKSVSNIIEAQVLLTPPPTSPVTFGSRSVFIASSPPSDRPLRTPTKALRPDDSGVCLSPFFPSSSRATTSGLPLAPAVLIPARLEAALPPYPWKRPRPDADASSADVRPPPPPPPSSLFSIPPPPPPPPVIITLPHLLTHCPIFLPPSHNITFKSLVPQAAKRASDLLPTPANLHPFLSNIINPPSALPKLVLLSLDAPDREQMLEGVKAAVVANGASATGRVLVLNVWCVKDRPRKGEEGELGWRRRLVWDSEA